MLRRVVERDLASVSRHVRLGGEMFLMSRPAESSDQTRPLWVLYESGSIVLRRNADESAVVAAAMFALTLLRHASSPTGLLPMRLRPVLNRDGRVVLAEPRAIHDIAGLDRALLRRGVAVFPATVVSVDYLTAEVVVPDQTYVDQIPGGRYPIQELLLVGDDDRQPVSRLLSTLRTVLRVGSMSQHDTLVAAHTLVASLGARVRFMVAGDISDSVLTLGRSG